MRRLVDGKYYEVSYVFNMVGNYVFTRKGFDFLVDAEDVQQWAEDNNSPHRNTAAAVEFAREVASLDEDGVFWWKAKESR